MARRGRKRDPNARRRQTTVAGRAPAMDHGTLEAQLRRAEMVNAAVRRVEAGRVLTDTDLALSGSQLGILLARGVIDRRQFEAGERYQALAWAAHGRPFARAVDIARPRGEGPAAPESDGSDEQDRRHTGARRALARLDARLAAAGAAAARAVKQVCQFDRPASAEAHPMLRAGLEALALLWEGRAAPRTGP